MDSAQPGCLARPRRERRFPCAGPPAADLVLRLTALPDEPTLRSALVSAIRAPSIYNSQPWRWRAGITGGVDLFADPDRHLIAIDLDGRDLLLSCGAALHHLVVALAGLGWSARIERLPDPENSDHLARVTPQTTSPPADTAALAAAIGRRRTDRRRFSAQPVGEDLLAAMVEHAAGSGAELYVVADADARRHLIEIMAASASLQRQQMGYAAELAQWTSRYTGAGDGIESDTVTAGIGRPGEVPMRTFPHAGLAQSPHSFEHDDASTLMVLATDRDDRLAAPRAGEATSAVLLGRHQPGPRHNPTGPAAGSGADTGIDQQAHRRTAAV